MTTGGQILIGKHYRSLIDILSLDIHDYNLLPWVYMTLVFC